MIDLTIAIDLRTLAVILAGLFLFGCGYAVFVYRLGEDKSGYVASFVVLGVAITLGAVAILSWQAAALSLACFAASGAPMWLGEIGQHIHARKQSKRESQERVENKLQGMGGDDQA